MCGIGKGQVAAPTGLELEEPGCIRVPLLGGGLGEWVEAVRPQVEGDLLPGLKRPQG